MSQEPSYKDSLLLPQTSFPMRGDLVKKEPLFLEKWEKDNLYKHIQERRKAQKAPRFLLHDGPPFANGDVHMGTALNKVLKDLVLKSKTMEGFQTPYRPGWDCHGLPIEYKVMQDARDVEAAELRRRCEAFARNFIGIQKESFRRLGVFGEWENPYLTMDPSYEANILRTFGALVEQGAIYQSKKPVIWSYGAKTALAEAEVEYLEKKSPAIFVRFALSNGQGALKGASLVIWTTTPWTLPSNLAIALNEQFKYICGHFSHPEKEDATLIIAEDLVESFTQKTGFTLKTSLCTLKGAQLVDMEANHPFLPRSSKIIVANFVTAETGTGAVHIAPGHGADDYIAGQQNQLGVLSPVDDEGCFTPECGLDFLVGKRVFDGNQPIMELLEEKGALLGKELYAHQYPHCWRSKTPIIFRAVEQFFISLKNIRHEALKAIDSVQWLPHWGRNRIYGTVESRPDWCISRQRTWGVPLPVFFDKEGKAIIDKELIDNIANLIEKNGSNIWFEKSDEELATLLDLPAGVKKCQDTLDVWIDSGSSHVAVMDTNEALTPPADLYLEATDQHRGWFQSSLMLSIAVRNAAPYKTVMTHGFVVDTSGKKISKSGKKPINAKHYYDKFGADIVRLWAASVDWEGEVPFSDKLFAQVTEPYRRFRNTLRIILGNLHDFDKARDAVEVTKLPLLDAWVLEETQLLIEQCRKDYAAFAFRKVFSAINAFCANTLSALYIDITKDRLYCDSADSLRRRATQTVLSEVLDTLLKLMAPITVFTCQEAWEHANREGNVHLQDFPSPQKGLTGKNPQTSIQELLSLRPIIQAAIEKEIQAKHFQKNNEASITLTLPANHPAREVLKDHEAAIEFFIISSLQVIEGQDVTAQAQATDHPMCPRCRRYSPLGEKGVCTRCQEVLFS